VFEKPVPKSRKEALIRDLVTSIPLLGDILLLKESIDAFKEKKYLASILYIINILPLPTLPMTHLIVYELEKEGKEESEGQAL
jgi:hypothetical protein